MQRLWSSDKSLLKTYVPWKAWMPYVIPDAVQQVGLGMVLILVHMGSESLSRIPSNESTMCLTATDWFKDIQEISRI